MPVHQVPNPQLWNFNARGVSAELVCGVTGGCCSAADCCRHGPRRAATLQWSVELQAKVSKDCTITEKAPTRAFSWLKAPTGAFTFKTLLRHYAKRALTPRSLNVKLGRRHNYHEGRAAIRHYANQTARPL